MVSLVTKNPQHFFPKRSKVKWEEVENLIPPPHLSLPLSLFSSGGVLRESPCTRRQNRREGDNDEGAPHTRSLTSS